MSYCLICHREHETTACPPSDVMLNQPAICRCYELRSENAKLAAERNELKAQLEKSGDNAFGQHEIKLRAENSRLRDILWAARKFIPVAGDDGFSTALAKAIRDYDHPPQPKEEGK